MKNFIIFALLALCLYLFFFYKAPVNRTVVSKVPPEAEKLASAEVSRVNTLIDKKGFEHALTEEVSNTVSGYDKLEDSAKIDLDSVKALRELDKKQIKHWMQQAVTFRDSFMMAKKETDSTYRFKDNFANIEFVNPTKNAPAYFNYSYDAKINYLEYWEKKNIFAKRKDIIDFWIEDPRATINGVKRIKFIPKERSISAEVSAKSIFIERPFIGANADLNIGRFSLGGGYYYDMLEGDWKPIISAEFKILQF